MKSLWTFYSLSDYILLFKNWCPEGSWEHDTYSDIVESTLKISIALSNESRESRFCQV